MENKTNNPATSEETGTAAKKSNKKLIIILSSLLVVLAAAGGITYKLTNNLKYDSLVRQYNQDFESIQAAGSAFKKQIETPPVDKKTLKEIVSFYENSKSTINFEAQVKELNSNPKYASLTAEKKDYPSLNLDNALAEYKDRLKDIEKLQSVIQRSDNIDSEIRQLKKPKDDTYTIYSTIDALVEKNNKLKDEMLSVVLSAKLKDIQSKFVDALTYRGKYLTEMQAAHEAASSNKYMESSYERNISAIKKNKQLAQGHTYPYEYIDAAYKAANSAESDRKYLEKSGTEQRNRATEAASMLAKYVELTGAESADLTKSEINPQPLPQSPAKPSGDEEMAKAMVEIFLAKSMWALSTDDIKVVTPYLSSKKHQEQANYMQYLKNKGIKESMTLNEAKSAEKLDDSTFIVTTSEKYKISYGDGSSKTKSFTSKYKVLKTDYHDYNFVIDELLEAKETESKDS
ncbi:hypothetical protein NLX71_00250 [Paenibacillus sp. MZ04-78.2]|uniref:TcaA NTF2-like domain-containing protein n=1 Tax=Paenibacillus sp. MZ04-78.2 TaxID=2962034 RepID=UPI0020B71C0A|nr:hypothetical protein [Paenibacillus sp. MZ04-78.2]MCP3771752.1 hypothetical protein [Paenibacillus sp. MZ04-78.2]